MNNTNAHTSPYGIAGVRSSTIRQAVKIKQPIEFTGFPLKQGHPLVDLVPRSYDRPSFSWKNFSAMSAQSFPGTKPSSHGDDGWRPSQNSSLIEIDRLTFNNKTFNQQVTEYNVSMPTYTHTGTYVHTNIYIYIHTQIHMCIYIYAPIHVCIYIYNSHIHTYIHTFIYIYTYTYTYAYTYTCTVTHTHTHTYIT